jgi:short-subunit dehydrogenase
LTKAFSSPSRLRVGGGVIQPLADANAKTISEIFGVNVVGQTLLAAAIPHLEEAKGAIVNMSST